MFLTAGLDTIRVQHVSFLPRDPYEGIAREMGPKTREKGDGKGSKLRLRGTGEGCVTSDTRKTLPLSHRPYSQELVGRVGTRSTADSELAPL